MTAPVRLDEARLRALTAPRPGAWLRAVLVDWASIVATFGVVAWVDHPAGYVLALVPLGSRQQALGALFHDAAHRLITRSRFANDLLGSLLAAWPLGLSLGGYRRYHFAHHRHLGTDADPEITHRRSVPDWPLPARPAQVARDFALDLVGGGVPHLIAAGSLTRPVSVRETLGLGAFWLAALAVAWRLHMVWVPLLWVSSIATVFWSGVRLRIWTEHLGTRDTHRIAVPRWLAHLIMPHSIGLHWEHHHWPGVPFSRLAELRAALPPGVDGAPAIIELGELARSFTKTSPPTPLHGRGEGSAATASSPRRVPTSPLPLSTTVERGPGGEALLSLLGHVVAPMLAGALVYVLCRPVLPRALAWWPMPGWLVGRLPPSVVDVAPDALWAYALMSLVILVWRDQPGMGRRLWMAATVAVVAGWEVGQGAGLVPGSFDPRDLVFSVAGCALAMLLCPGRSPGDHDHAH